MISRTDTTQALDLIGDVHGCYDELCDLLANLGWLVDKGSNQIAYVPDNRLAVFVGDLNDRGPSSDLVFELVMDMVNKGVAKYIRGNHDDKLYRYLKGNRVSVKHGLDLTVQQLQRREPEFSDKVREFIKAAPICIHFPDVIVVHAAYIERASEGAFQAFALYGVTDGRRTPDGKYLLRDNTWKYEYTGRKHVVVGHDALESGQPDIVIAESGAKVVNIDTACCFGGNLTCLRFPEWTYVQVPAKAVYCPRG